METKNIKPANRHIIIVCGVVIVTVFILLHLRVSLTRSLDSMVFWRQSDHDHHRVIISGDYVTFDQSVPRHVDRVIKFSEFLDRLTGHPVVSNKTVSLLKRVGCSQGELLSVDSSDLYYCNGRYLGRGRREVAGQPIVPFRFNGRVPAGMLFVVGDDLRSFDSRVYGFISRDRITGVAWALI